MNAKQGAAATAAFPVAKADKGDATTRAARDIITRETAERDAKTARLRALRLAKEAEEGAVEAETPKPKPKPKKKPSAKPKRAVTSA